MRVLENRLVLFLGVVLAGSLSPVEGSWKAGVAKAKITPSEPIWLAGYEARDHPSEGVLQDIYVKALALEDEHGAVSVLVAADLLGFTADMSKTISGRVREQYGLPRSRLILNASHTHSGPVTGNLLRPAYKLRAEHEPVIRRYTAKLLDQVVNLVGEAIENLEPAELMFGQGLAGFAVNRRRARSGRRHLPGPVDHDVPVLLTKTADGSIQALVFGYACHATVLSGYEVSGDWPGFAQEAIEKKYPGAIALFVTGCGADANPLPRRSVELARRYGETLATAADRVVENTMRSVGGPLNPDFRFDFGPLTHPTLSAPL